MWRTSGATRFRCWMATRARCCARRRAAASRPSSRSIRARGRFYVTHHLGATIGVYDLGSGTLLKTLPTGGGPYGIALDAAAGRLYTADRDGRSVTIVDVDSDRIIKHMPLNCVPYQVAVNPASGHLFVVCADDRQMHIYDLDNTRWLAWVPVGRGAEEGIAVDTATGRVYVSNSADDTVSIIQDSGPVNPPTLVPTRTPTVTSTPTVTPTPTLHRRRRPHRRPPRLRRPPPHPRHRDPHPLAARPAGRLRAGRCADSGRALAIGGGQPSTPSTCRRHRLGVVHGGELVITFSGRSPRRASAWPWWSMRPTEKRSWPRSSRPPAARRRTWPGRPQRRARYYLRARAERPGRPRRILLLSVLALPNSLYLPLISRNDSVEPAKAVFETEDKGQESGDQETGVRGQERKWSCSAGPHPRYDQGGFSRRRR